MFNAGENVSFPSCGSQSYYLVEAMIRKASLTSSDILGKLPVSISSLLQSHVPPTAHAPALMYSAAL